MSARYCLMACERGLSVFAVDCANLISGVNFISGVGFVLMAVLADANEVNKSVMVVAMTTEEINGRVMCFMSPLFPHLWERTEKPR